MEETTDALGLMEGREGEWRQESEEGRSTRQKSDGRKERRKGRAEEKLGTEAPITLGLRGEFCTFSYTHSSLH